MYKTTVLAALVVACVARAEDVTLPVPAYSTGETVTAVKIIFNGKMNNYVRPMDTTNGVSWVLEDRAADGGFLRIAIINQHGEPVLYAPIAGALPSPLIVSREELIASGQALGIDWLGPTTADQMNAVLMRAFVRKIGTHMVPAPALEAWTSGILKALAAGGKE